MKYNKYIKVIGLLVIVILMLWGGYRFYLSKIKKNTSDEIKLALNEQLTKPNTYDGLDITNIEAYKRGNINYFRFNINNNNETTYNSKVIDIVFFNKTNDVIYKDEMLLGTLKPGETTGIELILDPKTIYQINSFVISDK